MGDKRKSESKKRAATSMHQKNTAVSIPKATMQTLATKHRMAAPHLT